MKPAHDRNLLPMWHEFEYLGSNCVYGGATTKNRHLLMFPYFGRVGKTWDQLSERPNQRYIQEHAGVGIYSHNFMFVSKNMMLMITGVYEGYTLGQLVKQLDKETL